MALAMIEGCGSVEKLMKAVEGNAPKIVPTKKDIAMTKPAVAQPAKTAKSPIARLYSERSGKKVVVEGFTFMIEVRDNAQKCTSSRCFTVCKSNGDALLGRFIFARELDYEQLAYKPGSPVEIYDDKVALHALLRPLALAEGLAKAAAPKQKKIAKTPVKRGKTAVANLVVTPLVRMDTVVAPDSQPVANFGIARLLSAPAERKVAIGGHAFVVEEGELDGGRIGRRYICVKAPEDAGLGLWVTDDDVCLRTSPRLPDSMGGKVREQKIALHQLLRDSAIDAGIVKGKYAIRPTETIVDQAVCLASVRDGIEGRYMVQHPDYDEDAIVELQTEDGRHGKVLQIILVRNNQAGLKGISAGTRIAHRVFMKRLRPEKMPKSIEVFADWLDEAVF